MSSKARSYLRALIVAGEPIRSVTRNGHLPIGTLRIDGRGKFLMPGLWDMHSYIEGNEKTGLARTWLTG